jgi:hypothetical protein
MNSVKCSFILHPQKNESGTGDADSQSKNIQKTVAPIFPEIA